jgi:hypothetical protein
VALFRIKVGREIGSAALVADGYHARADGLTSLAVLVGATGVWLATLADPMVGLLITVAILHLVWQSARAVFTRMLDGVDPEVLDAAEHAARHVPGVHDVAEVRARWIGHRLTLELNVAVNPDLTVTEGHGVAKEVRHQVLHHVPHVSGVTGTWIRPPRAERPSTTSTAMPMTGCRSTRTGNQVHGLGTARPIIVVPHEKPDEALPTTDQAFTTPCSRCHLIIKAAACRIPMGPLILLTVRGRKSGKPRTPVDLFERSGRSFLVSAHRQRAPMMRNLRTAGEGV